jgi:hypothetical protein
MKVQFPPLFGDNVAFIGQRRPGAALARIITSGMRKQ